MHGCTKGGRGSGGKGALASLCWSPFCPSHTVWPPPPPLHLCRSWMRPRPTWRPPTRSSCPIACCTSPWLSTKSERRGARAAGGAGAAPGSTPPQHASWPEGIRPHACPPAPSCSRAPGPSLPGPPGPSGGPTRPSAVTCGPSARRPPTSPQTSSLWQRTTVRARTGACRRCCAALCAVLRRCGLGWPVWSMTSWGSPPHKAPPRAPSSSSRLLLR